MGLVGTAAAVANATFNARQARQKLSHKAG
ncbi:hypothetical protein HDF11_004791 [Tunturiibacter psychrotolerans]